MSVIKKCHIFFVCLIAISLLLPSSAVAVNKVKVMALFSGKAMLQINGNNRLLKEGQVSQEGVKLISATPHEAILEIDGKRGSYQMGSSVYSSYAEREHQEVVLWPDKQGSFLTSGSINGQSVKMLVDTGATSIAMSEVQAKRLGLAYQIKGERIAVRTASGVAKAYALKLDRVRVGEITLFNVEAAVVQGNYPANVLLGMSFLKQLDMINEGNKLILRTK
ncbi:MAG: TIGR02281 family clan AA aspartic protease [Chromatiales bacterium]|nr:TIGR02281 family clan AA aspartic protease [Chromatiales bacterium]